MYFLYLFFTFPGIFHEHIKYLLCVTTPINIYLLGVNFTQQSSTLQGNAYGTIGLHPEPLFVVATDNVYMTAICGTDNGRIFLAGKDSCLYELVYQVGTNLWILLENVFYGMIWGLLDSLFVEYFSCSA